MGNSMQKEKFAMAFGEPVIEIQSDGAIYDLYKCATALVEQNKITLSKIQEYRGCQDHVRKSMSSPTNETYRRDSLSYLVPNIELIQEFYFVAAKQGVIFHRLVSTLAKGGPEGHPELFKRLADIISFCLMFDNLKTTTPAMQNDLSYYRRYVAADKENQAEFLDEALTNSLSFFVADNMPMLHVLIRSLQDGEDSSAPTIVAQLANLSCGYLNHKKNIDNATEMLCLRAMTGAILVYDHSTSKGAFRSKSTIKIKSCLKALEVTKKTSPEADQLFDSIRYWSCHLNDAKTPNNIRAMFQ